MRSPIVATQTTGGCLVRRLNGTSKRSSLPGSASRDFDFRCFFLGEDWLENQRRQWGDGAFRRKADDTPFQNTKNGFEAARLVAKNRRSHIRARSLEPKAPPLLSRC
jgi:hypothetical protein